MKTILSLLIMLLLFSCSPLPSIIQSTGTVIATDGINVYSVFEGAGKKKNRFKSTWVEIEGSDTLDMRKYSVEIVVKEIK